MFVLSQTIMALLVLSVSSLTATSSTTAFLHGPPTSIHDEKDVKDGLSQGRQEHRLDVLDVMLHNPKHRLDFLDIMLHNLSQGRQGPKDVNDERQAALARIGQQDNKQEASSTPTFLHGPTTSTIHEDDRIVNLLEGVKDKSQDVRKTAFRELAQIGQQDNKVKEARAAIVGCLADGNWADVRRMAVGALTRITQKGDEEVIAAISGGLALAVDVDWVFRSDAVRALAKIANTGDEKAIAAISGQLADGNSSVRCAAVRALAEIADKDDKKVIAAISGHLNSAVPQFGDFRDSAVRQEAVRALAKIAEKDSRELILGRLADSRNQIITAISGRLADSDSGVRARAVSALAWIAIARKEADKVRKAIYRLHLSFRKQPENVKVLVTALSYIGPDGFVLDGNGARGWRAFNDLKTMGGISP